MAHNLADSTNNGQMGQTGQSIGITFPNWVSTRTGKAVNGNPLGGNGRPWITFPKSPVLVGSFGVSIFARATRSASFAGNVKPLLALNTSGAGNFMFGLHTDTTTGQVRFTTHASGGEIFITAAVAPTDAESSIVGTYDGVTMKLYVDGILQASTTSQSGALSNVGTAYSLDSLSNRSSGNSDTVFFGNIRQLGLWGRPLTAAEVRELYVNPYAPLLPRPRFPFLTGTATVSAFLKAHPILAATMEPIAGAYATLTAFPIMAAATGPSAGLQAHPTMTAYAEIQPSAFLMANPIMSPSVTGAQLSTCVVQPQPEGIGSGGTVDALVF